MYQRWLACTTDRRCSSHHSCLMCLCLGLLLHNVGRRLGWRLCLLLQLLLLLMNIMRSHSLNMLLRNLSGRLLVLLQLNLLLHIALHLLLNSGLKLILILHILLNNRSTNRWVCLLLLLLGVLLRRRCQMGRKLVDITLLVTLLLVNHCRHELLALLLIMLCLILNLILNLLQLLLLVFNFKLLLVQ